MPSGELMQLHIGGRRSMQNVCCRSYIFVLRLAIVTSVFGCSDMLSKPSIPNGTQSPTTYLSRNGALAMSRAATEWFREYALIFTINSGLLTDELSTSGSDNKYDNRSITSDLFYGYLHQLRGQARITRGALADYASDLSPSIRGELFAFEAYAELWLADLYCSGVPLSTLDYKADFTYRSSSTTHEVYEHALVLFDSALALAEDSPGLRTLANVGKGRALLSLGQYELAATAVQNVMVTDQYRIRVLFGGAAPSYYPSFARDATVSDNEGENGLYYRTSGDPRTRSDVVNAPTSSNTWITIYFPVKYALLDSTWLPIATGVESELIKAEAALHRDQPGIWLSILNRLRTTGTYSSIETTPIGSTDTVWNAGTGGIPRLRPLQDPGTDDSRINMLFAERAAWLFVTGQRQADLRRLVREYGRDRETVYPTGIYNPQADLITQYGSSIAIKIGDPHNPYFQGCLSDD